VVPKEQLAARTEELVAIDRASRVCCGSRRTCWGEACASALSDCATLAPSNTSLGTTQLG
jgi:hypothetical protein